MKIRKDKDIVVKWTVTTNGESTPLDGRNLTLVLRNPMGRLRNLVYTIEGNTITTQIPASVNSFIGEYSLTLWENKDDAYQTAVDAVPAYTLVSTTNEEDGGEAQSNLEYEQLALQGDVQVFAGGIITIEIVDNLTSTDTDKALSANQGRVLNEALAAEVSRAQDAEAALGDAIDAVRGEIPTDYATQNALNSEIARATGVEATLQAQICEDGENIKSLQENTEDLSTIRANIATNATAVATETTRALEAEAGLQQSIDAVEGQIPTDYATAEQLSVVEGKIPTDYATSAELEAVEGEVTTLTNALDGEVTRALAAEADLQTQVDSTKAVNASQQTEIEKLQELTLEQITSYGIEFDTTISNPACTRIGNMALHKTLPVQSLMRGCLLDDDGNVVEYLPEDDWTSATRDGSKGQVMVEIPQHWRKCVTDGTKRQVWLSLLPLEGYHEVPRMYVSAYEATVQRSTGKLSSVVSEDTDYRGGNNNANYDGTYRTFLGRPATQISRTNFRKYARNRNAAATAEWNCYLYQAHKAIFWLFTVEYATLNSQAAYNSELTSEGYRQGGLGAGVTNWDATSWNNFNGYFPFVPCGHTDTLGNQTGVVAYTITDESGAELKTTNVPRYRGIENPFGHLWKWSDGINIRISPTTANGGDNLSKIFICEDTSKLNDTNYTGYSHVGNEARTNGYVTEVIFGEGGEIMPSVVGGGSTQFFCDNHYTNIPTSETLRGVLFGGAAISGASAGFVFATSNDAPSHTSARIGSRLCFLPR